MAEPDQRTGQACEGARPGQPPADPTGDPATPHEPETEHDPTGVDLARRIAGAVASGPRRRARKKREGRPGPQLSSARPDDRDPQLIGSTVEALMSDRGWVKQITVHQLLGRWAVLVGPTNAAHSTPVSYADTVVTVRAESTTWATQLRQLAPQLVARLNDQLGDGTVTRVVVLGPQGPTWKKGRLRTSDGRGPRDTYG